MNVVYILSPFGGGALKSFFNMLEGLIKKGIKPIVILPEKNEIHAQLSNMGISTIVVTYRYNTYPPYITTKDRLMFLPRLIARRIVNRRAVAKIARLLSNKGIDIIHTNVSVIGIGHDIAQRLHVPHIHHVREYGDLDYKYKYYPSKKKIVKQLDSDYSIFITKDIQRHFQQEKNPKSVVIYNGIHGKSDEMPQKASGNYFLYLGQIIPTKGTFILVKAYSEYVKMADEPLKLYLVGGTENKSYVDKIHKYIKENNLNDNVVFLGNQTDVVPFLQKARSIIIPSIKEGFGRCMPEAMFCGCLAIAHNTGGSKEQLDTAKVIAGREIALRYDRDPELPQLLLKVGQMTDEEIFSYTRPAFDVVNTLYSNERNVDNVFEFYKKVLEIHHKNCSHK